ncbi:hypothetical protein LDJ79_14930, partial [Vibrio tritonius]
MYEQIKYRLVNVYVSDVIKTSSRRGFSRLENTVYSVPTINIEPVICYISGSGLFNTQIKCRL